MTTTKHKDVAKNHPHSSLSLRYTPFFNGFCVPSMRHDKPYFMVEDIHKFPWLTGEYMATYNPFISQHKDDCERLCNKLNQVLEDWLKGVRTDTTKNVDDAGTPY